MQKESFLAILSGLFIYFGCKNQEENKTLKNNELEKGVILGLEQKYFNAPSPIQIIKIFENKNIQFNEELLTPQEAILQTPTNFGKTFYAGVCAADYAYCLILNQPNQAIKIITILKQLLDETGITGILKPEVIAELEAKANNRDSIILLGSKLLKDMDIYLKENRLEERSVAIMCGGWLKSMLYASYIYEQTKDTSLLPFFIEQKYSYDNILFMLQKYSGISPEVSNLLMEFQRLSQIFEQFNFTIKNVNVKTDPQNKKTIVSCEKIIPFQNFPIAQLKETIFEIFNKLS